MDRYDKIDDKIVKTVSTGNTVKEVLLLLSIIFTLVVKCETRESCHLVENLGRINKPTTGETSMN